MNSLPHKVLSSKWCLSGVLFGAVKRTLCPRERRNLFKSFGPSAWFFANGVSFRRLFDERAVVVHNVALLLDGLLSRPSVSGLRLKV